MERLVGSMLAVLMFCTVVWAGLLRGLPAPMILERAALCALAGGLLGWLSVGPLGRALVQASTRVSAEPPPEETPQAPAAPK
jgi:hypothetical protein